MLCRRRIDPLDDAVWDRAEHDRRVHEALDGILRGEPGRPGRPSRHHRSDRSAGRDSDGSAEARPARGRGITCATCSTTRLMTLIARLRRPSSDSVATITRRARGILNLLPPRAMAGASSASAARAKASGVGAFPSRTASAAVARHGLCATPPSATRTSRIGAVLHVAAPRRPTPGRTRSWPDRAPCGSRGQPSADAGRSIGVISSPGCRFVSRSGVSPGSRWKSLTGSVRVAAGPARFTVASSAASATHMSEGCVAMQCGAGAEDRVDAVEPVDRVAAAAGLPLVAPRGAVVEVVAARPLHQVAADGRHVPQLRRGAVQDRLRQQRVALANRGWRPASAVAHQRADAHAAVGQLVDAGQRQRGDVDQRAAARCPRASGRSGWCRPRGNAPCAPAGRARRWLDGASARPNVVEGLHRRARFPRRPESPRRCRRRRRSGTNCRSCAHGFRRRFSSAGPSWPPSRRHGARHALAHFGEHRRPPSRSGRACSSRTGTRRAR